MREKSHPEKTRERMEKEVGPTMDHLLLTRDFVPKSKNTFISELVSVFFIFSTVILTF